MSDSKEVWKPVPGYEGYYEVSNKGRVRSLDRTVPCRGDGTRTVKGKVLNPTSMPYERVCLGKNGNEKTFSVHQLVARVFIRPPKEGEEINHIDCTPSNNHVENLEWVTHAENEKHAVENERRSGEMQSNSKLTDDDVRTIRKTYQAKDVTYSDLASRYSVSKGLIGMVVRRERWKHID